MLLILSVVLISHVEITFCAENSAQKLQLKPSNIPTGPATLAQRNNRNNTDGHLFDVNAELQKSGSDAMCDCWNATGVECRCHGYQLRDVPRTLSPTMEKLIIQDVSVEVIRTDDLHMYAHTLEDITLDNLPHLTTVESGVFENATRLRSIYITQAPLLKSLNDIFFGIKSKKFLSLRIMHTGLQSVPDLSYLQGEILHMIDLEDNKLCHLSTNSVKIKAEQVLLSHNNIEKVDRFAFNGSQIAKLSLKGNRKLTYLHKDAFNGLKSLLELDLSGTSIQSLPVIGLAEMEVLRIQDTRSLKVIPSLYNFKSLKEAWLTHSFHCCAFKYPAQHDPTRHALHEEQIKQFCAHYANLSSKNHSISKRNTQNRNNGHAFQNDNESNDDLNFDNYLWDFQRNQTNISEELVPIRGEVLESLHDSEVAEEIEDLGYFHQTSFEMPEDMIHVLCGTLTDSVRNIECYPKPDALNPCEDIMGFNWLRISVWFVVITAVIGNFAVVVVFFSSLFDVSVPKFLMCHLAFADLCMGIYLLLIAVMDLHSMGFYFNFAFDWQIGYGCQMAGFLTVFSSQLSVFTLTVITLERWFAIRYAIYLNRRINLSAAAKIMIFGWLYSILLASLPLVGISNYSSTSICLPMEAHDIADKAYLIALLITNGFAFLIIVICYTQIYFSLGKDTRRGTSNNDMTIAKKMALLVFTDFACWAPIAFFGLTAIAGYPLINVTKSKILLVFFYPLNSCANPYLYAILTSQYRKDFFMLLYKCGVCKKHVRKFTVSSSLHTTNQSHPLPLLPKMNARKISKATVLIDDALV